MKFTGASRFLSLIFIDPQLCTSLTEVSFLTIDGLVVAPQILGAYKMSSSEEDDESSSDGGLVLAASFFASSSSLSLESHRLMTDDMMMMMPGSYWMSGCIVCFIALPYSYGSLCMVGHWICCLLIVSLVNVSARPSVLSFCRAVGAIGAIFGNGQNFVPKKVTEPFIFICNASMGTKLLSAIGVVIQRQTNRSHFFSSSSTRTIEDDDGG